MDDKNNPKDTEYSGDRIETDEEWFHAKFLIRDAAYFKIAWEVNEISSSNGDSVGLLPHLAESENPIDPRRIPVIVTRSSNGGE